MILSLGTIRIDGEYKSNKIKEAVADKEIIAISLIDNFCEEIHLEITATTTACIRYFVIFLKNKLGSIFSILQDINKFNIDNKNIIL